MARYEFTCAEHGPFEIERSIKEDTPLVWPCPEEIPDSEFSSGGEYLGATLLCGNPSRRLFSVPGVVWAWKN